METVENTNEHKNDQATASAVSRNTSGRQGTFEFVDNRAGTVAQRKRTGEREAEFDDNRETTQAQSQLQSIMVSNNSTPLQRKIIIGEETLDDEKVLDYQFEFLRAPGTSEMIERMHNKGKPPNYVFADEGKFKTEIMIRSAAIQGMEEIHKGCCEYFTTLNPPHLDANYWESKGFNYFVPKQPLPESKNASDAIKAIFNPTDGKKTRLDCWTIMIAVAYYSVLKGVGDEKFNQLYPGGQGLEISWRGTSNWPTSPSPISKHYKTVSLTSSAKLLPGDWVYFKNFQAYLTLHPNGYLQGENAIYMGNGKFQGFGSGLKTEQEMNEWLVKACYPEETLIQLHDVDDLKREGGGLLLNKVKRPI